MREGWSLKKMHRLMVTSAVYRMESSADKGGFLMIFRAALVMVEAWNQRAPAVHPHDPVTTL